MKNDSVIINGVEYVPKKTVKDDEYSVIENHMIKSSPDHFGNCSVRDVLHKLLEDLLIDPESFSGKRPFGNSGWVYALYTEIHLAEEGIKDEIAYDQLDEIHEELNVEIANEKLMNYLDHIFYKDSKEEI